MGNLASLQTSAAEKKGNKFKKNLVPNVKLVESLRNIGYDNYTAIADLIDNSIDAEAKDIIVKIESQKVGPKSQIESVIISDNGVGMTMETLQQALTLGSDTSHDSNDLGCFGMGLNTAALSFGKRITAVTSMAGTDKINYGVLDLEDMVKNNSFESEFWVDENPLIHEQSFTIITVSKLQEEDMSTLDPKTFASTLKKRVGKTFRHLLGPTSALAIKVNKTTVKRFDPLLWDHKECIHLTDGWVPVDMKGVNSLEIRACILLDVDGNSPGSNTGVYWIRNNRDITNPKAPDTSPFWSYHPRRRGIIFEVRYDNGELDPYINLTVSKKLAKDSFSQSLTDNMMKSIRPLLKKADKILTKKAEDAEPVEKKEADEANLEKYANRVKAQGKKMHTPPKIKKETNGSGVTKKNKKESSTNPTVKQVREANKGGRSYDYEWVFDWPGPTPMMHPTLKGDNNILIQMNVKHPYVKVVKSMEIGSEEQTACLNLFTSMATAKLMVDENNAEVRRFFTYFDDNAATLVSNIPKL